MKHEKISALVDGELEEGELASAIEMLRSPEAQAKLNLYYKIGDALKAESATMAPSPEFARRMAILMEAEPPLGEAASDAEKVQSQLEAMAMQKLEESRKLTDKQDNSDKMLDSLKHLAIPGIAAMAAVAVVMSPQFMFIIQANTSGVSNASCTAIAGAAVLARKFFSG